MFRCRLDVDENDLAASNRIQFEEAMNENGV